MKRINEIDGGIDLRSSFDENMTIALYKRSGLSA